MPVILTSFKKSHLYQGDKYSTSRFQPKGFTFPELRFLAAEGANGGKLSADLSLGEFEAALLRGYKKRWNEIKPWLRSLDPGKTVILTCWCPFSKASAAQVKNTGFFICHTGLIGKMIQKHRPDIKIVLDEDREKHLVREWVPEGV